MENNEPKNQPAEIDVPTALSALAREVVKLDRRTVALAEANATQTDVLTAMCDAQERILAHHQIACRRIAELLVGLGADFEGVELRELRSLFNMEPPPEGPKQN